VPAVWRYPLALVAVPALVCAQWYAAPAGIRPPSQGSGASILPGGRIVAPAGGQFATGPSPFGLAVSAAGKAVATAVPGPDASALTLMERGTGGRWEVRQVPARAPETPFRSGAPDWRDASRGLVFSGQRAAFVAEGAAGRISLLDWNTGRIRAIDLNRGGAAASYAGALAFDASSGLLYAADAANSRIAVIEARSRQVIAWAGVGLPPAALALSPDRRKLYVAAAGALRVVDVSDPSTPKVEAAIATGPPDRAGEAPAGPFGVAAAGGRVFVSNGGDDSVTVIDAAANRVEAEIPIRIPGFESLRGVLPAGLAYHAPSGLLLVAEAGINAVGVIDTRAGRVIGHIPAGWFPTGVAIGGDSVFALNARGAGPNAPFGESQWLRGSVSVFPVPSLEELPSRTALVMEANGFQPRAGAAPPLPAGVRYVVLIVKEGRSYDETLGDIPGASNGPAMSFPDLARFGTRGYVDGRRQRLSIKDLNITPNHHAIALQWAFSDNFYADSPSWTAALEHLGRHGAAVEAFGARQAFDANIRDQDRAAQFIGEIEKSCVKTGAELPRLLFIHLPNDRTGPARASDGYPYEESFVADNDLALGRILEFLSGTKWWNRMAVFVTENDALGGVDHIDARRTVLLCAGPWIRRNYVSHANTGFPGLLKTIFRLLGAPPMSLLDAAATDLSDCFRATPDPAVYRALPVDQRLFDPAARAAPKN